MSQRKVRTYDKEFKLNAINLYLESGKTYQEIGDELGIPSSTLVGWVFDHRKHGSETFPGKGHIKSSIQRSHNYVKNSL